MEEQPIPQQPEAQPTAATLAEQPQPEPRRRLPEMIDMVRIEEYSSKAGRIEANWPVKATGENDGSREPKFFGKFAAVMFGKLQPLRFEIHARTLDEAVMVWPAALEATVNEFISARLREQIANPGQLVVPPK